jgi:hypothetical protein
MEAFMRGCVAAMAAAAAVATGLAMSGCSDSAPEASFALDAMTGWDLVEPPEAAGADTLPADLAAGEPPGGEGPGDGGLEEGLGEGGTHDVAAGESAEGQPGEDALDMRFPEADGGEAELLLPDADGDGVPDGLDNCPDVANAGQEDFDLDLAGDACDDDDDGDGWLDDDDCAPLNAAVHPETAELCDGLDNDCDGTTDVSPAATCKEAGICAGGVATSCQGSEAVCDYEALDDWCSYDICDGLDNDCDGELDELDWGACCDCDMDEDWDPPEWLFVCDPVQANPDDDGDGILDVADNCPLSANPGQEDFDLDLMGDACDVDDDNDGDPDATDCASLNAAVHAAAAEVCNGIDDNCDSAVDEGFGTLSCGLGLCANSVQECVAGVPQPCVPLDLAAAEACDLLDNDCDGAVDEEIPDNWCGAGVCAVASPGCLEGIVPPCVPNEAASGPEACDSLDNDCDGQIDEELGTVACGAGPCVNEVAACAGGVPQQCVPKAPPPGTCNAQPAYCKTTTIGTDACGNSCSKVGPAMCYTVHQACLTSNPGAPTDSPTCLTPKGNYDCGLSCQDWPNSIGADCVYCKNIFCQSAPGKDKAQFQCNNVPAPPTN